LHSERFKLYLKEEMMKPMPKPTNSKKDLAQFVDRTSRNHSKLSRLNGKKVKLSRRDQSFNSSMLQWVDKRKCMDRWNGITERTRLMN
jgi:hypothetical protein